MKINLPTNQATQRKNTEENIQANQTRRRANTKGHAGGTGEQMVDHGSNDNQSTV